MRKIFILLSLFIIGCQNNTAIVYEKQGYKVYMSFSRIDTIYKYKICTNDSTKVIITTVDKYSVGDKIYY